MSNFDFRLVEKLMEQNTVSNAIEKAKNVDKRKL